jgi:hypothetical protein
MLGASRAALIGAEAPGFTFISTTWTNGSATYYTLSDSNKTISRNTNSAVWPNPSYITDNWSTGIRSIDIKLTAVSGTQRIQLGVVTSGSQPRRRNERQQFETSSASSSQDAPLTTFSPSNTTPTRARPRCLSMAF